MAPLTTPLEHRAETSRLIGVVTAAARRRWAQLGTGEFDGPWSELAPQILALLTAGQLAMGREAARYVPDVLQEQNITAPADARPNPRVVAGVAASGMPLEALMAYPLIATRSALAAKMSMVDAQAAGGKVLDGIVKMQMQDAGRAIESVAAAVRPRISGYVRHLSLPSCKRCVPMAGRVYRWNDGFQRHPKCDCFHVPIESMRDGENLAVDPIEAIRAGQVTGLSQADTKAILDDGADPNQVINASRGMYTGQVLGRKVKATREGITSRGLAGQRAGDLAKVKGRKLRESQTVRLRPETIYKIAGDDRGEALRLLRRFGYVL